MARIKPLEVKVQVKRRRKPWPATMTTMRRTDNGTFEWRVYVGDLDGQARQS